MKLHLNFSPQSYRTRQWIAFSLYSLSCVLIALLFLKGEQFKTLENETQALKTRIEQIQAYETKLQNQLQKRGDSSKKVSLDTLEDEISFSNDLIFKKSFYWTQFLSDLEKQLPKEVAIRHIQPSFDKGRVKIGGSAKTLKTLTRLMTRLQSDKNFEDVLLLDQKPDLKSRVKNTTRFTLTFRYLNNHLKHNRLSTAKPKTTEQAS